MNKSFNLILWVLFAAVTFTSGEVVAQAPKGKLKLAFSYKMVLDDGTNASAVAWNSQDSKYITVIAGNEDFPLEVFTNKGKPVTQSHANFDWRGLWYNPNISQFEGNGAGDLGWASLSVNDGADGYGAEIFEEGQYQPDMQSVGAFDFTNNKVVFWEPESTILECYDRNDPENVQEIELKMEYSDISDLNRTTVGFTGHVGYEFVLLNFSKRALVFFDQQGKQTARTALPKKAPCNDTFAFSFANDRVFLYDKDARIWYAYKVF